MATIVSVIIGLLAVALVLFPLAAKRAKRGIEAPESVSRLQGLMDRRDTLMGSLRELEYDKQLGNLSDPDYRSIRDEAEAEVIALMKALDTEANDLPDRIEDEVRSARDVLEAARRSGDQSAPLQTEGDARIERNQAPEHGS